MNKKITITLYDFIIKTFDEDELLRLCDSNDELKKVHAKFSQSMSLGVKVSTLIKFCERRGLSEVLREKVKEERETLWENHQVQADAPTSNVGRMRETKKEVNDVFKEIKTFETMDAQIEDSEDSRDTTHPLSRGESELKKWFAETLNTDEQVFFLTSALFSGLEKHEFLKLYDGINEGLQAEEEQEKDE